MDGSLLLLGVRGAELTREEVALFRRLKPAGYILFTRNIVGAESLRRLVDDLRGLSFDEPIIAIDQEGGRVTRTRDIAPVLPSAEALARTGDEVLIARAGAVTGDLLRLLGVNLNFAPVLDVEHFAGVQNALRERCWGSDAQEVIDRAGLWNRWMRKRGVAGCGKHFPGGGWAQSDPHEGLPFSEVSWEGLLAGDVVPYTALMPELDAVMLGHVMFTALDAEFPASLSRRVVTDLLRGQLGFDDHLLLTDDLDMGAIGARYGRGEDARLAIAAGNDLAMICHRTETAEAAAKAISELPLWQREAAGERVEKFRKKIYGPPLWSGERWRECCEEIESITAGVPVVGEGDGSSAVTRY